LRSFIDEYPEFRKLGSNVSKHVALVGELSRLVNERGLLQVSELEQSLASNESHGTDLRVRPPLSLVLLPLYAARASRTNSPRPLPFVPQAVREAISAPEIPSEAKLRLAILYALRYQKAPGQQIAGVVELLKAQGVQEAEVRRALLLSPRVLFSQREIRSSVDKERVADATAPRSQMVNVMLAFAGADQRQDDLFGNENFFSKGKSALKGLKVRSSPSRVISLASYLSARADSTTGGGNRASRTCTPSTRRTSQRRSSCSSRAGCASRATRSSTGRASARRG